MRPTFRPLSLVFWFLAAAAHAQAPPRDSLPPLPRTGLDFSAIDQFWRVADLLMKDVAPSEADWRAMLSSVGYRLSLLEVLTTRSEM